MAKILIIDDDHDLANLTKITLTKNGYKVSILHSADNITDEIKTLKPDLILMDIMMPGISGAEAVRNLKGHPQLKSIPVIFLTGLVLGGEEEIEKPGISVDGQMYQTLGKPYEIDELLAVVSKTLNG